MKVYNKQWKRVFTIAYRDDYGFLVDTTGIQHNPKAVRLATEGDKN
jgi:hypothetical protein|tara:strand:+ start:850 stop:987 length:138 start_codon:yes stop_codon:yes gene_type:complete